MLLAHFQIKKMSPVRFELMTFRHRVYYTNAYESYLFHRKNMVLMVNVLYAQKCCFSNLLQCSCSALIQFS